MAPPMIGDFSPNIKVLYFANTSLRLINPYIIANIQTHGMSMAGPFEILLLSSIIWDNQGKKGGTAQLKAGERK